ncbi:MULTISPECIES: alpha/beta hydrolase-fold protein [unclassified Rhodococcus (in: high G+C Gram-positive bacteria)]|uniref:alpha/beta hydrolase n=1 Tax=unclassified Rhodococcus (in: high G+C Gram-positive bacteria) TaxID=192944 RepID=UPI0033968A4E
MRSWPRGFAHNVVHLRIEGQFVSIATVAAIAAVMMVAVLLWVRLGRGGGGFVRTGDTAIGAAGLAAAVLVVLATAAQLNVHTFEYPTLAAALGHPPVVAAELSALEKPASSVVESRPLEDAWQQSITWRGSDALPDHGNVIEADIPGTASGFSARPASIYFPPAYLSDPRADLPVLVLLTGQPGHVVDWLAGGHLARTMDTFAAAHNGLAPVVVVADALGDTEANPMCMDSDLGNAFTYLSVDLPTWVSGHLQVASDPREWAIGGYSYGGTCALQTAVLAPAVYPTFLDISGEDEPRRGTREESIAAAFGDNSEESVRRFDSVAPLTVLDERCFGSSAGAFVVGTGDTEFRPQTERAFAAAKVAGVDAHLRELPGGHSMDVWAPALEAEMDWLAARMGLTS